MIAPIAPISRIARIERIVGVRTACAWRVALLMIGMLAAPAIAEAQFGLNCTISTTPVAFGDYNVLSGAPKTTVGSLTYECTLGANIIVTLSRGSSAAFDPRTMTNGAEVLNYNLYREATFQTIWGDGTGGTQTYQAFAALQVPVTVTVYGRVPAGQNVAAGSYSDSVVATIIF